MKLLLCCGGPSIHAFNSERIPLIAGTGLDWQSLLLQAGRHGMLPLLYWNLQQSSAQVDRELPPLVLRSLREAYMRNLATALSMTGSLLTLLNEMETAGVLAVPYKGPVLSSRLYGNLGLRQCVDLDVVVMPKDILRAQQALFKLGYAPFVTLRSEVRDFQVESRYSEKYIRNDSVVELHWAFTNKDVAFPLSLHDVAPRLTSQSISGRSVPVFSAEDMLLILCIHGAKHGWARLEWICGVAEAIFSSDMDWGTLFDRATAARGRKRLLLGLALAHDLFRAPLPREIENRLYDDRKMGELVVAVKNSLFGQNDTDKSIQTFGTIEHDLFHFRLSDRISDRVRYLVYRLTTPSRPEQWSTVSIMGRSIRLHSFTRPFGVIGKVLPVIWRRLGSGSAEGEE